MLGGAPMIIDSHAHYNNNAYKKPFRYLSYDKDGYSLKEGEWEQLFQELVDANIPYSIEPEDGSLITIEQAVVMEKGTAMIGTPKSFDSYRCVPVPMNFRYCARLLRDTPKKFVWETSRRLSWIM